MKAWLIPTETAQYNFFVRSDDASQLFISQNATFPNPKTATPVAEETGCCDPFKEQTSPVTTQPYETTTTPIQLTAGQQYAVVYIVKEGGGGDWGQVAWRKVGDTTPASSLQAISANAWYYGPAVVTTPTIGPVTVT